MSTYDTAHARVHEVEVPGAALRLLTDGERYIAVKPIVEHFGLDWSTQHRKLSGRSWATMVKMTMVAEDGKNREMTCVDRRTLTMWLATLNEDRVRADLRAELVAYQSEAADALDAYFHSGGAVNPRATEHQANALLFQARAQIELCQAAKGLIHPDHLEAKARVVLARGLGEHAELDAARKPLYTSEYLKAKSLSRSKMKSVAGVFGKRVKAAYTAEHGRPPRQYPLDMANGQVRDVNAYTEADRPLMDRVWAEHYAPGRANAPDYLPIGVN